MAPENVSRGGDRFIPGSTIPGDNNSGGGGSDDIVDGAETAGAFNGVADSSFVGDDGLGFADLLDVINPLQHIPVIANLYRAITGDQISPPARMAGGTLFGGPIGFVSSLVNRLWKVPRAAKSAAISWPCWPRTARQKQPQLSRLGLGPVKNWPAPHRR